MESDEGSPFLLPAVRGQDISPNLFAAKLNALLVLVLLESWTQRMGIFGWRMTCVTSAFEGSARSKKHRAAGLGILLCLWKRWTQII